MEELISEDEFVSVNLLVPKHLVGAVYRAVANVIDGNSSSTVLSPPVSHGDVLWWTKDKLTQLKQDIQNPTVIALLDLTQERAGEWVLYDEIYEKAGRSARQAQGDLAGLTQLIKKKFGHKFWPVEIKPGTSSTPYSYRLPRQLLSE